jgi:hypothetical protein
MGKSFEYRFVRLGEYAGSAFFGVHDKARNAYEEVVHEHARDGWRLVQIFAPGVAAFGAPGTTNSSSSGSTPKVRSPPQGPVGSGSAAQNEHEERRWRPSRSS